MISSSFWNAARLALLQLPREGLLPACSRSIFHHCSSTTTLLTRLGEVTSLQLTTNGLLTRLAPSETLWHQHSSFATSSRPPSSRTTSRPGAPPSISALATKRRPFNTQITAAEVRVVLPDNDTRIMDTASALRLARQHKMDLVEINSTQTIPVCKIMDYRDYLDEQKQKLLAAQQALEEKELKESKTPLKEMRFTVQIADHDLEVKLRKVVNFLEDGCRVLLVVKFKRGADRAAADQALDYILARLGQLVEVEVNGRSGAPQAVSCTARLKAGKAP